MYAVILAGGRGSRLWPLSTYAQPKQFLKLDQRHSLLQNTYNRVKNINSIDHIIVTTHVDFGQAVIEEYNQVSNSDHTLEVIAEPASYNTAAAITAAAYYIQQRFGSEQLMLILPSDHIIADELAFHDAIVQAQLLAKKGTIVTLGITPKYAEVNYGYIEHNMHRVLRFTEKPSLKLATEYVKSGNFLWNSGMLCCTASTMINEISYHLPDLLNRVTQCINLSISSVVLGREQTMLNPWLWRGIDNNSIDYEILSKSNKMSVVPCNIGWLDVGSWHTLDSFYKTKEAKHHD